MFVARLATILCALGAILFITAACVDWYEVAQFANCTHGLADPTPCATPPPKPMGAFTTLTPLLAVSSGLILAAGVLLLKEWFFRSLLVAVGAGLLGLWVWMSSEFASGGQGQQHLLGPWLVVAAEVVTGVVTIASVVLKVGKPTIADGGRDE